MTSSPSLPHDAVPHEVLACLPLFACLLPEELGRLAESCRIVELPKDGILFSQGEKATGMFVVLSGTVKVVRWDAEGRESVLHLVRAGNILAEAAVFQGGAFPASAVCVAASRLLFIDRSTLTGLVAANPELALRMLGALSLRLRMMTHKLGRAQHKENAARRVAEWLLHRSSLDGSPRVVPGVSRETLSGLLGLARETLSRTLSRLERDGVISLEGKTILITEVKKLERIAAM